MIERYCDGCGTRMYGERFIKAKVKIGMAKNIDIHAYSGNADLCTTCLVMAVKKAAGLEVK